VPVEQQQLLAEEKAEGQVRGIEEVGKGTQAGE
jgi:hypothetical protein